MCEDGYGLPLTFRPKGPKYLSYKLLVVHMKTTQRSVSILRRGGKAWLLVGAAVLWMPLPSKAINTATPGVAVVNPNAVTAPTSPVARYSAGIGDIVKLVDAKVDPEVIKTYVNNSPTAYNPSASEIIALKDRGVGSDILTAILQRGAAVRAQAVQANQAAAAAVPPPYPAPTYDYGAQPGYYAPSYVVPTDSYPSYAYASAPYYSGYCGYGCGWPYYWPWLSFNFGCYPYCGYGGNRCCWYGGHYCYGGYGHGGCYGHGGYCGNAHYSGWTAHGGSGSPAHWGSGGASRTFAAGGHATMMASSGGGFSGHSVSFGGHGGGFGGHGGGGHR